MAGIHDKWTAPDGSTLRSFSILTIAANDFMRGVHDRMPVLLASADIDAWISGPYSNADGTAPVRLTREIQHDVVPQFLGNERLLAAMGEPRHRRSYVYDLKTGARQRLFHNNTLRTIAPEYSWTANADGTRRR